MNITKKMFENAFDLIFSDKKVHTFCLSILNLVIKFIQNKFLYYILLLFFTFTISVLVTHIRGCALDGGVGKAIASYAEGYGFDSLFL